MKKSKTFWAATALISLAVMVLSGYSIYGRLSLHFWGDTIEVRPVPMPLEGMDEEEEEPLEKPSEPAKAEEARPEKKEEKPAPAPDPEKTARAKAVKTLFEYNGPGKSVQLAGSFTSWKAVPMKQRGGIWKAEVYILPGTYPYHFKVDGQKTADKGKPLSPTGDSLVTVEPRN